MLTFFKRSWKTTRNAWTWKTLTKFQHNNTGLSTVWNTSGHRLRRTRIWLIICQTQWTKVCIQVESGSGSLRAQLFLTGLWSIEIKLSMAEEERSQLFRNKIGASASPINGSARWKFMTMSPGVSAHSISIQFFNSNRLIILCLYRKTSQEFS